MSEFERRMLEIDALLEESHEKSTAYEKTDDLRDLYAAQKALERVAELQTELRRDIERGVVVVPFLPPKAG